MLIALLVVPRQDCDLPALAATWQPPSTHDIFSVMFDSGQGDSGQPEYLRAPLATLGLSNNQNKLSTFKQVSKNVQFLQMKHKGLQK